MTFDMRDEDYEAMLELASEMESGFAAITFIRNEARVCLMTAKSIFETDILQKKPHCRAALKYGAR